MKTSRRVWIHGTIERADGDKPLRIVAATEGRKADGIDLRMSNVDLERYDGNPIIGYGHDYYGRQSLPIGKSVHTVVEGKRLMIDPEFDADDDFALTVERKLHKGYLNAVSIGFDAHDIAEDGVPARWELFETSVVPLPMDAKALVDGRARALAELFGDLRAGKVLSAKNKSLVKDAIAALSALYDAAGGEDDVDEDDVDDEPRDAPRPALERARQRLARLNV